MSRWHPSQNWTTGFLLVMQMQEKANIVAQPSEPSARLGQNALRDSQSELTKYILYHIESESDRIGQTLHISWQRH